ncbi:MAG: hypothetical protein Q8R92_11870 [Deltaproteobacteria bacterium]|nr:hypothetical protein [Deltaproteobacteria bacterium]
MILIAALSFAVVMLAVELARPGRRWPVVAGWWVRATLLNGCQVGIVLAAGVLWEPWMARHRLFSADVLGVTGGAVAGYLAITFIYYWWHRLRHRVGFL